MSARYHEPDWRLHCSGCCWFLRKEALGPVGRSREEARALAAREGWQIDRSARPEVNALEYCPSCATQEMQAEIRDRVTHGARPLHKKGDR